MRKSVALALLSLFALIGTVKAEGESFGSQFLASPLLILTAIIIIDIIAFAYHKIRK
jgi:hypothetical protein